MKYSIFGFSQEYAIKLQKEQDGKVKKLDATDLLILKDVADFMNRSKIIKYTIDDKVYFSIQYATILEDLPILDIKKQALSDRLDKMVLLNVLEKIVIKNQSGTFIAFRMGAEYEKLLYSCTNIQTVPTSSELQVQMYSTTNHNTNITNNSSTKQENKDESLQKKFNFKQALLDLGVCENVANDFLLVRKNKKATNSETAFKRIQTEIAKSGLSANDCITFSVENDWKGFKAEWLHKTYNRFGRVDSFSAYTPKKISDRARDYISTLTVPIQAERDGIKYLTDGTYIENGKRYYSHKTKGRVEVSVGAVARPNEDWEWNPNMLTWEQDERKATISDMLF